MKIVLYWTLIRPSLVVTYFFDENGILRWKLKDAEFDMNKEQS